MDFFRSIFFSREFSPAFYGMCTNLPDGQHRMFYLLLIFGTFLCEPIVQWLVCQAQDREVGSLNPGAARDFSFY
jgi:hypothetical protein